MSWPVTVRAACAAALLLTSAPAWAQYAGPEAKKKDTSELRAVAVLEWTGEAGKPKASRIVPVSLWDGEKLQDAGIYLARPVPLAVGSEVEYQLKQNGKTTGLYDVTDSGQEQGSWVGHGAWKPAPQPKPAFAAVAPIDDDGDDDKPVLHRKHKEAGQATGQGTPPPDKTAGSSGSSASGSAAPAEGDAGRPTLHKHPDVETSDSVESAPQDPDRPVLKKPKPQPVPNSGQDPGGEEQASKAIDPDRPRLIPGKPSGGAELHPTLMGLPPDMQQAVAVSDPRNKPDHPWNYSWANPGDEAKMKDDLEEIARQALGLDQPAIPAPPAPAPKSARRAAAGKKAVLPAPPPEPAPLRDESFRVFELAYGSGATMVLSADTGGPLAQEKFVTLLAQPDLYGNVVVLYKNVTQGAQLDENPHLRLIDAVDALADNRGELLFELRGRTMRQFALFRVLRGSAEKIFTTSAGYFGSMED